MTTIYFFFKRYLTQKKIEMAKNWITVFGRAGCGVTENFVEELSKSGHPFAYLSMPPGMDRDVWWGFVQRRAPEVVLPRTFPTVIVWEPTPTVYDSSALKFIKRKDFNAVHSHKPDDSQSAHKKSVNYFKSTDIN
jgi:hypothetical protein